MTKIETKTSKKYPFPKKTENVRVKYLRAILLEVERRKEEACQETDVVQQKHG